MCIQNPYRTYVPVNIAVRIFLWMGRRCMYTLFHMEEAPSSAGRIALRVATYHTYTSIGYNAFCCTTDRQTVLRESSSCIRMMMMMMVLCDDV